MMVNNLRKEVKLEEKSKDNKVTFSILIELHNLMLEVRMMKTSMHNKILTCIVS